MPSLKLSITFDSLFTEVKIIRKYYVNRSINNRKKNASEIARDI